VAFSQLRYDLVNYPIETVGGFCFCDSGLPGKPSGELCLAHRMLKVATGYVRSGR
jgi:hypothetical protein